MLKNESGHRWGTKLEPLEKGTKSKVFIEFHLRPIGGQNESNNANPDPATIVSVVKRDRSSKFRRAASGSVL